MLNNTEFVHLPQRKCLERLENLQQNSSMKLNSVEKIFPVFSIQAKKREFIFIASNGRKINLR